MQKLSRHQALVEAILEPTGIQLNGSRPFDIQVHNDRMFRRVIGGGELALCESYLDGDWNCDALDEFSFRILRFGDTVTLQKYRQHWASILMSGLLNLQTKKRAFEVGAVHYDIGNAFYGRMLDERTMSYSCGLWRSGARDLSEAQLAKIRLVCEKLQLRSGQRVLDVGCGWGSFGIFAARNYGAEVVGITVSDEQARYVVEHRGNLPVEALVMDYRDVPERFTAFDRIVSIGMFEHVGPKNYKTYMRDVARCLKEDGLFLLHTIGGSGILCPWIHKYVFPNGILPRMDQIVAALNGTFRVVEDWDNFGADYDKTLTAWHANFVRAWPSFLNTRMPDGRVYDARFYRLWSWYLLMCAGAFRARKTHLWQIILSKHGVLGGYRPYR